MNSLYIFLTVFFVLVAFAFILAFIIFSKVSVRKKPKGPDIHSIFSQNKIDIVGEENLKDLLEWSAKNTTDDIYITSGDGLKLHCAIISAKEENNAKGVVIVFHGFRSFGARDFCQQLPIIHEAGYHIMLVDQRSHGKSEGKYICYGTKERDDALLWRKKATELFGEDIPIALFGLSMGGATVLMTSGLLDTNDPQVKCVVADCPFYSPYEIIKHVLWRYYKIYPYPIIYVVNILTRAIAKFNMRSPSCADYAKSSKLPFLIFHGKEDKFVPTECSVRLSEALGDQVKLVLFEEAQHAEAIYYNKELYKEELLGFLAKYMQ